MAVLDYVVIGCYLAAVLGVGVYYSRRPQSVEGYLLGGRTMKPWQVGVSLFAGTFSTISYLMIPGEVIQHGPAVASTLLAIPVEATIICLWIIPSFMKTKIVSAYELLERRLGVAGRLTGSILFLAPRLAWMALILFLVSQKVLVPSLGWPAWAAPILAISIGTITVAYATLGGIRAVVASDVIQALVLFGGALVTIATITLRMHGFGWIPHERPPTWDVQPLFSLDPYVRVTIAGMILYCITAQVVAAGGDQLTIQRFLVTQNVRQARKMYCMSALASGLSGLLLPVVGFALLGFFRANPALLGNGLRLDQSGDKIFPYYIMHLLPAGITGLLISALLAAAMGSVASGINSGCTVLITDFFDRFRRQEISEVKRMRESKWLTFAIGVVVVLASLEMGRVPGNILEICARSLGLFLGGLFTLFFMALFVPWATAFGTIWAAGYAILAAVVTAYWDALTGNPSLSFTLILPTSVAVGLILGPLLSCLRTKGKTGPTLLAYQVVGAVPLALFIGLILMVKI